MNPIVMKVIISAIYALGTLMYQSGIVERVIERIKAWGDKEIPGDNEKQNSLRRHGVMDDIENVMGFELSDSDKRLLVQLGFIALRIKKNLDKG